MSSSRSAVVELARAELGRRAVPEDAGPMAAYMKTDMPFYGVKKPGRRDVLKRIVAECPPAGEEDYRGTVMALWEQPHREEKYLAIGYARAFPEYVTFAQIDLYERLVREGAWWDLVDEVATHLVGEVVRGDRDRMRPVLERWIDHDDLWLRRTAVICQLKHGADTDAGMLFDYCHRRAPDPEFFIRKAVGWALREYSRTDPDAVASFLERHGDRLSPLSVREAARHLRAGSGDRP